MKLLHTGLFALALRRALPWGTIAVWSVLVALLLASASEVPASVLVAAGTEGALTAVHGLARADRWGPLGVFALAWTALCAARTVPHWRKGECDWLGSRATTRATILGSSWLGTCCAALALLGASALAIELSLGAHEPVLERVGAVRIDGPPLLRSGAAWKAAVDDAAGQLAAADRLRIELALAAGPPAVDVVAVLSRSGSLREAHLRLFSRARLEIELPPGDGPLTLSLACNGSDAIVILYSEQAELWCARGASARASVQFFARCALAAAVLTALGLGLGSWMGLGSAAALLATLALAATLADPVWRGLPCADLPEAFDALAEGRAPGWPAWTLVATSVVSVLAGLALARLGLARWRGVR